VASRHRIEHLTTVRDDQVQRIADLGVIASVQHTWYSGDAVDNLTRWPGDLVVLAADPTRVPSSEMADVEVLATVVDGRVGYCGPGVPPDLAPLCPT